MMSETSVKFTKNVKYLPYRNILYHRFFVGLFLFLVISIIFAVIFNLFSASSVNTEVHEPFDLDNLDYLPVVQIKSEFKQVAARDPNCTYWDCFNVYRCGRRGHSQITVYIYPLTEYHAEDGTPIAQLSREFYDILDAVRNSKYYTADPNDACLLIPSIDTLNQHQISSKHVAKAFQTLAHWSEGENHLIFNMIPGSTPNFNTVVDLATSKALIAGAGFDTWTFRYGLDISIPVFSAVATTISATQPQTKSYLIISAQMNVPYDYLTDLQNIASASNDLLLLDQCQISSAETNGSVRCQYMTGKPFTYPDVLKHGMFCLMVRSARLAQVILLEILASGCIPIVIADSIVMPFDPYVDWHRVALFIPEENISNLLEVVSSVSEERKAEMLEQTRWLYDKYFASMEKITLTTLEIINEKVFPLSAKLYEDWNLPEHLYGPSNPLFLPVTAPKSMGFTAVILTYDRVESLFTLIKKLVKTPSLAKILVIWNNQKKAPPPSSEWPVINKPLKVIQTKDNKLSNRFYPYPEIETECQLTIDDDINMLTPDELEFGFDVWREFPDRIVGFPSRLHRWDNVTESWKYHSEWTNEISMVLTGAAFHHKIWSWYYTTKLPEEIKHWVDDNFNCEDIAMNFLVANITNKAPIKVAPRKKFKCPECTNTEMLSADAGHMSQRSQCVDRFARAFGRLALRTVEFRADPLQYREGAPPAMQAYRDIGAL